ncbi:MAG: hypothetical protein Q8K36_06925 [Alphaproteobacteria bacterium]|nr:hypothetical protein [Alphaproteobacteria bacterium]
MTYRLIGTTQTFVKLESALAHVYEASPGFRMPLGKTHDKLLAL